jgi:hypothetical protein
MFLAPTASLETSDSRGFCAHTLSNLCLRKPRFGAGLEEFVEELKLLGKLIVGLAELWVFLPCCHHVIVCVHGVPPSTVSGQYLIPSAVSSPFS